MRRFFRNTPRRRRGRESRLRRWAAVVSLSLFTSTCSDDLEVRLLAIDTPAVRPSPPQDDAGSTSVPASEGSEADELESDESEPAFSDAPGSTPNEPETPSAEAGMDSRVDAGPPDAGLPDAGLPDPRDAGAPPPTGLDALLHHYDFEGEGEEVVDRVGQAHGVVLGGAVLEGAGALTLDGVDDYVDLPNGLISSLEAVTFVTLVEWDGGGCWHRVFDFGSNPEGEDAATSARTSIFMTPASCPYSHVGRVQEWVLSTQFHVRGVVHFLSHDAGLARGVPAHLALSVAPSGLRMYLDGALIQELPVPLHLADIEDVNNWLGRSQWGQDAFYPGRYYDFRIYGSELSPEDVAQLHAEALMELE